MNWTQIIFESVGGLGLFLMGMKIMSESMQRVAGERLRKTLNILTSNRFMGVLVGLSVTAVIQSSSATTVMVVGFVNAGLMSLVQAIGVILGANIGTTITGWIITLKIVKYALPVIGIGVFIRFFSKNEKWRYYGEILFGFGLLFLGMETMKAGFAPLRSAPQFIDFFTKVDGSGYMTILLGVLIGAITTFVVQSSSATIGITIALASQGLLNYEGAVSLILGENIGTTITALLASIGANYHAKRAAIAHTLFNVLGVAVVLALFFPFAALVEKMVPGVADLTIKTAEQAAQFGMEIGTRPIIGKHIAMAHTLFNITNVLVFTALIPMLAKLCTYIIPTPKETLFETDNVEFPRIESHQLRMPSLRIMETEKRLVQMAQKVTNSALMVKDIISSTDHQQQLCDKVLETEKNIDEYQKYITEFLVSLSSSAVSGDAHHIGNYMALSHYLEKYGDHLEHITLIYDKLHRKRMALTNAAREDVISIFEENQNFFNSSFNAMTEEVDGHVFMDRSRIINRRVKQLIKAAKKEHFKRLREKTCENKSAIYYMDLLNYLDGMRSQAYNIAEVTTGTKYRMAD